MHTVQSLIDECIALCNGNKSELARRLNMYPQDIHELATGKRPASPDIVALLCDMLELPGAEAREIAAWATILHPKNLAKREQLKRAFFGGLASGVVAICLQAGPTDAKAATINPVYRYGNIDVLCILCQMVVRVWRWRRRGGHRLNGGFGRPLVPAA